MQVGITRSIPYYIYPGIFYMFNTTNGSLFGDLVIYLLVNAHNMHSELRIK